MKRFIKIVITLFLVLSLMPCVDVAAAANVTTVEPIDESTKSATNCYTSYVGKAQVSGIIPGLKQAVTCNKKDGAITTCTSMTPQGMTIAGNYILISAYCDCGKHNSVIYIIDKNTRQYKSTLILDTNCHVGGIAVCGNYIWVCDSSESDNGKHYLLAYKYSDINIALKGNCKKLYRVARCQIDIKPSYICSDGGDLYVGTYDNTYTNRVYFYTPQGTSLKKQGYITIYGMRYIQGISIRNDYMVVTSSWGWAGLSNVCVYKDSTNRFAKSGKTYASPIKTLALPTMAQGCYIESNNTYFLFESGAEQYRRKPFASPLDKYLGFSNSTLGIK